MVERVCGRVEQKEISIVNNKIHCDNLSRGWPPALLDEGPPRNEEGHIGCDNHLSHGW
jgi:hypothetical protein